MQDLHHTPIADEDVYYAIRRDIIFGRLPAGERLRLTPLAERYGSSVSALRERLVRLVSEGFATGEGQRGFYVADMSEAGLRVLQAGVACREPRKPHLQVVLAVAEQPEAEPTSNPASPTPSTSNS